MNDLLKTEEDYVVASDTDSIYLKLGGLVDKVFKTKPETKEAIDFLDKVCDGKIQSFIDKSYKDLADYIHAYDQKDGNETKFLLTKAYGLQRRDMF